VPVSKAALRAAAGAGRRWKPNVTIGRVISRKGLAVFTRQLCTLTRAGVPLVRALEILGRQEKNAAFRAVLTELVGAIRSGGSFSDGLRFHPKVFDRLYVSMVKAGEAGGVLTLVLERLATFTEKSARIKARVISALVYPSIIMTVAVTIVSALMVFVVPKFQGIFASVLKGQPLPRLTQAVIDCSDFVRYHVLAAIGLTVGCGLAISLVHRTRAGARMIDWLLLHAPPLGDLFLKAAVARFARTFGTLLASGVPMLQTLLITRDTTGNGCIAEAIGLVHDRVKTGDGVARTMEATRVFPAMVTGMIEVGEETGALPEMLGRVADTYEEEVDQAVNALTTLIEPVMIVLMAFMVGTIVIALFLPIIRIIQLLS
jgi:type IV pilus assembly protein PilC